jgi:hypothetical protein
MNKMTEDPIIEIFSGSLWEAEMIKTLLKEEGIESFIRNTSLSSYVYEPIFSAGIKVMILSSDFARAKPVIDEFWKRRKNNPL